MIIECKVDIHGFEYIVIYMLIDMQKKHISFNLLFLTIGMNVYDIMLKALFMERVTFCLKGLGMP